MLSNAAHSWSATFILLMLRTLSSEHMTLSSFECYKNQHRLSSFHQFDVSSGLARSSLPPWTLFNRHTRIQDPPWGPSCYSSFASVSLAWPGSPINLYNHDDGAFTSGQEPWPQSEPFGPHPIGGGYDLFTLIVLLRPGSRGQGPLCFTIFSGRSR